MGGTAATTLDQFGGFAYHGTCIEVAVLYQVLADHDSQQGFLLELAADGAEHIFGKHAAELESQVFYGFGADGHRHHSLEHLHATDFLGVGHEFLAQTSHTLLHEVVHLLLEAVILFDGLADDGGQVLGIVEESLDDLNQILLGIDALFGGTTRDSLDAAHAGGHAAFAQDADEAQTAGAVCMTAATEFYAVSKLYHADAVTILLAKQGNGAQLLGFCQGHVAMVLQGNILADAGIDDALHLTQLLARHLLEVAEVKAQRFGRHERAFLLHMGTEHFAQRLIQQVGGRMIGFTGAAGLQVHTGMEVGRGIGWQLFGKVDGQVVFALCIKDFHPHIFGFQHTAVSHLTTHFGVEGSNVEYQLVIGLLLLLHAAVTQDAAIVFRLIPAHELRFALGEHHPVVRFHGGGVACALLLLLHLGVEGGLVYAQSVLSANELGQVKGKSVGIKERESFLSVYRCAAGGFGLVHDAFQQVDTRGQCAQEGFFFLLHHAADELLLSLQFGIGVAHFADQCRQELVHESFALSQESIGITHGAAQDAADDVAGLGVRGQLSVSNRKCNGAQVVCNDAHGHVRLFLLAILESAQFADAADDGLEHVSIVVRVLALHHTDQALKSHAGIDDLVGERFQRTVGLAIVLHENEVPNLNHLRVVLVHQFGTAHGCFFLLAASIDMDFGARTAGTRIAHLPEVVVLVAIDDMVLGEEGFPVGSSLVVTLQPFFF